jgi:hypothetical protein
MATTPLSECGQTVLMQDKGGASMGEVCDYEHVHVQPEESQEAMAITNATAEATMHPAK